MKTKIKFAFLILVITSIISCDNNNEITPIEIQYMPMENDTEWIYLRQAIKKEFESEISNRIIKIDTLESTIKTRIEKDTVLCDTMNVKIFSTKTSTVVGGFVGIQNLWSYDFKYIDSEGLKNYAYISPSETKFKSSSLESDIFNRVLPKSTEKSEGYSDNSIRIENIPSFEIELPLHENSAWTYREPTEMISSTINKKVIGYENIRINGESFFCYKVKWEYFNDPFFENIEVTEWISKIGVVKNVTNYSRTTLMDENGDTFGNIQLSEIITLKEFKNQ